MEKKLALILISKLVYLGIKAKSIKILMLTIN